MLIRMILFLFILLPAQLIFILFFRYIPIFLVCCSNYSSFEQKYAVIFKLAPVLEYTFFIFQKCFLVCIITRCTRFIFSSLLQPGIQPTLFNGEWHFKSMICAHMYLLYIVTVS